MADDPFLPEELLNAMELLCATLVAIGQARISDDVVYRHAPRISSSKPGVAIVKARDSIRRAEARRNKRANAVLSDLNDTEETPLPTTRIPRMYATDATRARCAELCKELFSYDAAVQSAAARALSADGTITAAEHTTLVTRVGAHLAEAVRAFREAHRAYLEHGASSVAQYLSTVDVSLQGAATHTGHVSRSRDAGSDASSACDDTDSASTTAASTDYCSSTSSRTREGEYLSGLLADPSDSLEA